jgi:hypothetical protein
MTNNMNRRLVAIAFSLECIPRSRFIRSLLTISGEYGHRRRTPTGAGRRREVVPGGSGPVPRRAARAPMTRTSTFTACFTAARGVLRTTLYRTGQSICDVLTAHPGPVGLHPATRVGPLVHAWSRSRGSATATCSFPHAHGVLSPSHSTLMWSMSHLSAQGSAPQCSERRGPSERHAISRSIACLFPSRANRLPIAIPCSRYAHAYSRCPLTNSCRRMPLHLMLRLGVFPLLSSVPPLMPNGIRVHDSIREGKLPPKALAHPWA